MHCPYCQGTHPDHAKFCPVTGNPFPAPPAVPAVPAAPTCPNCRQAVKSEASFCPFCGYTLKGEEIPPPPPTSKKKLPLLFWLLLGLAVLVIAGVWFFILGPGKDLIAGGSDRGSEPVATQVVATSAQEVGQRLTEPAVATEEIAVSQSPEAQALPAAIASTEAPAQAEALLEATAPVLDAPSAAAAAPEYRWELSVVDGRPEMGVVNSIAVDSKGRSHIAYFYDLDEDLIYATKPGNLWQPETVDSDRLVGNFISLAIDSRDQPQIAYFDRKNKRIKFAQYLNRSWRTSFVTERSDPGIINLSLALDANDQPLVLYYDNAIAGLVLLRYNANRWTPGFVARASPDGLGASLKISPEKIPCVSFYDSGLKFARLVGDEWQVEPVDPGPGVGVYSSLAFDTLGNPQISYYEQATRKLKFAFWDGAQWQIEVVDPSGDVGPYSSLAVDQNGAHISYSTIANHVLHYAFRSSSGWTTQVVDANGPGEQYSSIALGGDGLPRISYYDFQGLKLKTAQAYQQEGSLPAASQPATAQAVAAEQVSAGYPSPVVLNGNISDQTETLSRQNLQRLLPLVKMLPRPNSSSPLLDLAWSYDSQILAFRTYDEIFLFDRTLGFIKLIKAKGQALAFSPSGPYLAYSDELDLVLKIWDYANDRYLASTKMNLAIVSLRFSRDGKQLGSGHQDDSLGFWKVPSLEYYGGYTNHDKVLSMPLEAFDFSPDGKIALAASYKEIFKLYVQDKTADLQGKSMAGAIHSLTYSPDGRQYAACSANTELHIWFVDGLIPSVLYDLYTLEDAIVSIVYSKTGDILFGLEESGRLVALSPSAPEILATFTAHDLQRMGVDVELSPDGGLLASASSDGSVVIWGVP